MNDTGGILIAYVVAAFTFALSSKATQVAARRAEKAFYFLVGLLPGIVLLLSGFALFSYLGIVWISLFFGALSSSRKLTLPWLSIENFDNLQQRILAITRPSYKRSFTEWTERLGRIADDAQLNPEQISWDSSPVLIAKNMIELALQTGGKDGLKALEHAIAKAEWKVQASIPAQIESD